MHATSARRKPAHSRRNRITSAIWVGVIAAALIIIFAPLVRAQIATSYLSPAEQATDNISLGGCVIRFDTLNSSGTRVVPRIHANAVHQCVGATGVHVNTAGSLVVDFDGTADAVVSMMVGADETFARWGIMCGPSAAAGAETIACYRNGSRVRADSRQLYSHTANLWLLMTWWSGA